ncbi:MAG TPA: GGDEF domain-containing protein [Edaphobacter sp.]|uniref:GGDEF domain-containing protein n=1 Tax=Edaphobacter sp. TaxID=1934404 RepID=UPI002B7B8EDC|nr:GGDEF domain-containing protein [Edaphobacter sp.]HUZ96637.1 GGDEF domain-containing protein [Edaphobacter sp.]
MESNSMQHLVTREIERLSGVKFRWPKLPPILEERFEQNIARQRSAHLWYQGLIAIILFDLFAVIDYFIGDGSSWKAVILRAAVITPLALLVNATMRWNPGKVYREASVAVVIVIVGLTQLYIQTGGSAASSAYAQAGLVVCILFANLVMRLQFTYALTTSVILFAGDLVFLHFDHFLDHQEQLLGLTLTGFALLISMVANFSFGRQLRLVYLMLLRNEMQSEELAFVNAELHRISSRDNLTGLANRHSFELYCGSLWQQALSDGALLSAIVIDIDRFKAVNDLRGHLYGDKVLTRVASLLQQSLRGKDDFAARFGGEEFVVLLPQTSQRSAMIVAERIRKLVEVAGSPAVEAAEPGTVMPTTVSCGVATCLPGEGYCIEDLLEAADKALYEAKRSGRNRVCAGEVSATGASHCSEEMSATRIGAQSESSLRATARKVLWG